MAIITEENDTTRESPEPEVPLKTRRSIPPSNPSACSLNPFAFWAYFTLAVSLTTLLFVLLPSLTPQDPRSWFLSLPDDLRQHYSKGRNIKVQINPNQSPIEVFTVHDGPTGAENVLIVHGLGCNSYSFRQVVKNLGSMGIHAVALDLPGSGFSDKSVTEEGGRWGGIFGGFWDVYSDIMEKGLFWGFDNLIEKGYVPFEENEVHVPSRKVVKPIELGPQETATVIGQVIDSMGLAPVHLVLHDSALGMTANWISENSGSVRSVTIIDSAPRVAAFPSWILEVPVAREFLLGFSAVYAKFLNFCCSKFSSISVAEAHRILLKGRSGRQAVVAMGKKLNHSFDLEEWSGLKGIKGLPMQVLWSGSWTKEWSEEGRRVVDALPQANFTTHSGGRWPQEDVADEIAEKIVHFVSLLPKTVKQMEEEPQPEERIKKVHDEAAEGNDHHYDTHGGHGHPYGHAHGQPAGFMDASGLDHGWGS